MSNKIGGDQQQYPTDEHLYAVLCFFYSLSLCMCYTIKSSEYLQSRTLTLTFIAYRTF